MTLFVFLYSNDKSTIETTAKALDYSKYCLQVTGCRDTIPLLTNQSPPDVLVIDSPNIITGVEDPDILIESIMPAPPILVISPADAIHENNVSSMLILHADDVLIKPFTPDQFTDRICAILNTCNREQYRQNNSNPWQQKEKPIVLVVENSPLQINVLLRYLEDQDMDITIATDGYEALKLASEQVPDLILLDVVLPGIDGFEVCKRFKSSSITVEVPVIIISTLSNQDDKLNGLRHGADDFITKPVDRRELLLKTGNLLKRKKHLSKLASQASKDPLTGLYNRRYMDFALKREIMDAESSESSLSLLMLDVDYFKHYNDTNGHPAGDVILKTISNILNAKLRQYDIIVRYGGDEFLVLLPKTTSQGVALVAEKIRQSVEDYPFPNSQHQPGGKVTVSLGATTFPQHATNAVELLKLADEALNYAKREGRNCIRIAGKLYTI